MGYGNKVEGMGVGYGISYMWDLLGGIFRYVLGCSYREM